MRDDGQAEAPLIPKEVAYGSLLPVTYDEVAGFDEGRYFEHPEKVRKYEGEGIKAV